jgi:hypothetical protein
VQYKFDKEKSKKRPKKSPKTSKVSPFKTLKGEKKQDVWDLTNDCDDLSLSSLRL